jgi:hypothetical protein
MRAVLLLLLLGWWRGRRAHSLELVAPTLDLDRVVDLLLTGLLLEEAATEHTRRRWSEAARGLEAEAHARRLRVAVGVIVRGGEDVVVEKEMSEGLVDILCIFDRA